MPTELEQPQTTPQVQPEAQAVPDPAHVILSAAQTDDKTKADAWEIYHNHEGKEFESKLAASSLPQDAKAALWDAKTRSVANAKQKPAGQPQQDAVENFLDKDAKSAVPGTPSLKPVYEAGKGLYQGAAGSEESPELKGQTTTASPEAANLGVTPGNIGYNVGKMGRGIYEFGKEAVKDIAGNEPIVVPDKGDKASFDDPKAHTLVAKYVTAPSMAERQASQDEMQKYFETKGPEAAGHAISAFLHGTLGEYVPAIGPLAMQLEEQAQKGDIGGALSQIASLYAFEKGTGALKEGIKDRVNAKVEELRKTPEVKQAEANVETLGKERDAAQAKLDAAKAKHQQYTASHAQGIGSPEKVVKEVNNAQAAYDEAEAHHELAKEDLAKKQKTIPQQVGRAAGRAVGKVLPTPNPAPEVPAEKIEAAPVLGKLGAKPAPAPTMAPINVKTPGQVQPETFPQEPKPAPRPAYGRIALPNEQGTMGTPKLLTEGTPEGPQVPKGGLPQIKLPEEKTAVAPKPTTDEASLRALSTNGKGEVIETPEKKIGRLLQEALKTDKGTNKNFPAAKVEETPVEEQRATERRKEEAPVEDERRQGERRVLKGINERTFNESAFGKGEEKGLDTDAYTKAMEQARKELGPEASVKDVIKRRDEIVNPEAKRKTGDVGAKAREANPEPTREETKAVLPKEEPTGYAAKKEEVIPAGAEGREPVKSAAEYHPAVQQKVGELSDENLRKLATAHGLNPDEYNFKARDEGRHRVERDQLAKDITEQMGEDEKINLGRSAESAEKEGMFQGADTSSKGRASRAEKMFPRLRGPVDEFGNPKVSGGSQFGDRKQAAIQKESVDRRFSHAPDLLEEARALYNEESKTGNRLLPKAKMQEIFTKVQEKFDQQAVGSQLKKIERKFADDKNLKSAVRSLYEERTGGKKPLSTEQMNDLISESRANLALEESEKSPLTIHNWEVPEEKHTLTKYQWNVPEEKEANAPQLNENDPYTKTARAQLGKDATTDEILDRVAALKSGQGLPKVSGGAPDTVGTKEAADKDNEHFANAKKELGPNVSISEVAKRAQEMKDAAKSVDVAKSASDYNKAEKLPDIKPEKVEKSPRAKEIADEYAKMKHDPSNPEVKKSYDALVDDVKKQWDYATKKMGITIEPTDKDPYGFNGDKPAEKQLVDDVKNNKHLGVWRGGNELPADHPLAKVDPKTGETYNTMFRAVHDIFGHVAQGHDFSEPGEESAWNVHRQMMSPEAVPAMTTETRGQTSWFFNHGGEPGEFAEQKAGILPDFANEPTPDSKSTLEHIKSGKDYAVLTAENPNNTRVSPEENAKRNRELVADLRKKGYEPVPVEGNTKDVEGQKEHSYFVPDITPKDAAELGRKHGQAAVLTTEGLHDLKTDTVNPSDNKKVLTGEEARKQPYYTKVGDTDFSVPIDFDKAAEPGKAPLPTVSGASGKLPTGDELIKKYGESSGDPKHTTFILQDGRAVGNTGVDHDRMLGGKATDKNPPREQFIAEGNIRVRPHQGSAGREVAFSIPESGVSEQQLKYIQKMSPMLRSGAVAIEVGKPGGSYKIIPYGEGSPEAIETAIRGLGPVLNDKGSPIDWNGNPTVSGGSQAATGTAKVKALPKIAEEHLTDEEKAGVTKTEAGRKTFVDNLKKLPSVQEFTDIAKAGEGGRKWYQRSAAAFDALTEEAPKYFKEGDRQKFTDFLAALSPQQPVKMNLGEALNTWTKYVDEGRPEGKELEKLLHDELTLSGAKVPNAMKALAGEPLWPDLSKNANFKVPSFAKNLNGYLNHVTNDGWQALFGGLDAKQIAKANAYHPLAVVTRAAAEALGWEPAEAQSAIWNFTKTFTEHGETDPKVVRQYSEDFADIMAHDPEIRQQLKQLGVDTEKLDAKLRAIGKKPSVTSGASASIGNSIERLANRIETARGKGAIPPPKSGRLGFDEEDEETRFNPEDFGNEKPSLEKLGEKKKKSPYGNVR